MSTEINRRYAAMFAACKIESQLQRGWASKSMTLGSVECRWIFFLSAHVEHYRMGLANPQGGVPVLYKLNFI